MEGWRSVIAAAQRRAFARAFLRALARTLAVVLLLIAAVVIVTRLFGTAIPVWITLAAGVAVSLLTAATWAWWTRPSELQAASEVDQSLGLRDAIATACDLTARGRSDELSTQAVRDAESVARGVDIRAAIRLPGWSAWRGAALASVALLAAVMVPRVWVDQVVNVFKPGARPTPTAVAAAKEAQTQVQAVERVLQTLAQREPGLEPSAELERARESMVALNRELEEQRASGQQATQRAATALDQAASALERRAEETEAARAALRDRLAASQPNRTENPKEGVPDLAAALRTGDLDKAAESAGELAKAVESMPPAEREKLSAELKRLAEDIERSKPPRTTNAPDSRQREPAPRNETTKPPSSTDQPSTDAANESARNADREARSLAEKLRDAAEKLEQPTPHSPSPPEPRPTPSPDRATPPGTPDQTTQEKAAAPTNTERKQTDITNEKRPSENETKPESGSPPSRQQHGEGSPPDAHRNEHARDTGKPATDTEKNKPAAPQTPTGTSGERREKPPEHANDAGDTTKPTGTERTPTKKPTSQQPAAAQSDESKQDSEKSGANHRETMNQSPRGSRNQQPTQRPSGRPDDQNPTPTSDANPDGKNTEPHDQPLPSAESIKKLGEQLGQLAREGRRGERDRADAERLREQARKMWDGASPEQRKELQDLARKLAERGEHGRGDTANKSDPADGHGTEQSNSAPRPAHRSTDEPISTQPVDARRPANPEAHVPSTVLAEWLSRQQHPRPGSVGGSGASPAVQGAADAASRAAERAVEQRLVPNRLAPLIKRYFDRLNEAVKPADGAASGAEKK